MRKDHDPNALITINDKTQFVVHQNSTVGSLSDCILRKSEKFVCKNLKLREAEKHVRVQPPAPVCRAAPKLTRIHGLRLVFHLH